MPGDEDIEVVRIFIGETIGTYSTILEIGQAVRVPEREALRSALSEFATEHPERIVRQYAAVSDTEAFDAGIYGEQLRQKRELARIAADDLIGAPTLVRRRRFSRAGIRRWIKRTKVLVGSLKTLIPGAEALLEMLELMDAALDSSR